MRPARVLVINLASRPDRLDAFTRRWAALGTGMSFEVVPGVVVPGAPERGCYVSHLAALQTAAAAGPGPVCVFEDDAVFADGFSIDLPEPPAGWFLLRLGGRVRSGGPPVRPWRPVSNMQHTHAYVAADAAELLRWVRRRFTDDIGAALATMPLQYRLTPAGVGQAATTSDISGQTRDTDEFFDGP